MLSSASNWGGSSIGHWKLIIIGTPVVPGGADYAHHITTGTPGFSDPPTVLIGIQFGINLL